MPLRTGHQHHGMAGGNLLGRRQHSGVEHVGLHNLALAVHRIELGGDGAGVHLVVAQQQAQAQVGLADAPGGVDARAEGEAQGHGTRRVLGHRHV